MKTRILKILTYEHTRFLLGLFFISWAIRILFFWEFTRHGENFLIHFDSAQYQNLAQNIFLGNGITGPDGLAQYYRLPGYSLFLALCYKLFGHNYQYALLFQILIASLIPLLIFFLAQVLFPTQIFIAKISSIIASVHVGFVLYSGMLATESLFTLFFLGFLLFFFKGLLEYSRNYFFLAGLLLGFASLIRPVGLFVVLLSVILLFLLHLLHPSTSSPTPIGDPGKTPNQNPRKIYNIFERKNESVAWIPGQARDDVRESVTLLVKKNLIFVLSWLSVVIWWLARNFILSGFIFFHTLPGLHFLQYSATKIIIETKNCSYVQARKIVLSEWDDAIKQQEITTGRVLHDYEKCVLAEKIAYTYLKQHPLRALKNWIIEMCKTCCALYSAQIILSDTGVWPDYGPQVTFMTKIKRFLQPDVNHKYLIPIIYWDIIITILTLLGFLGFLILSVFDKKLLPIAGKTIPFIGLMIFLTVAYGCARLRLPIESLLLILAGYFWCFIIRTRKLS